MPYYLLYDAVLIALGIYYTLITQFPRHIEHPTLRMNPNIKVWTLVSYGVLVLGCHMYQMGLSDR